MNITTLNMISNRNRAERYIDFDQMEYEPIIASAIDIYADEMTTHSSLQPMLRIKCPNEEIKSILHSLYHNVLNIDHNLFGWSRTMCKYGDLFLYLDIDDKMGIRSCIGLPPQEIERLEGEDPSNPNYVQYQWNSAGMTLENWQMAHFRILGNDKHSPYGTSVLEPARRIWRQLTLLEDAMMAYRIVRSPERRVFKIDVGNIAPNDVEQYMQKVMTQMKRHQVVDPKTGRVDLRYNPLSIEEDYFIPIRGGTSGTEIINLPGGQFTGTVEDVKYLREKLFAALKVPQSYLVMGEGAQEDKTTLAQKDIRFARTIQRLQRVVIAELEKIGIIHLFTLGFRGDDLLAFDLALNNPSKIAELQELEHWKTKFDVAGAATEGFFSMRWIAEHMFGISEDEFIRMQREMFFDRKFMANLEAAGQAPEGEGGAGGIDSFSGERRCQAFPPAVKGKPGKIGRAANSHRDPQYLCLQQQANTGKAKNGPCRITCKRADLDCQRRPVAAINPAPDGFGKHRAWRGVEYQSEQEGHAEQAENRRDHGWFLDPVRADAGRVPGAAWGVSALLFKGRVLNWPASAACGDLVICLLGKWSHVALCAAACNQNRRHHRD